MLYRAMKLTRLGLRKVLVVVDGTRIAQVKKKRYNLLTAFAGTTDCSVVS